MAETTSHATHTASGTGTGSRADPHFCSRRRSNRLKGPSVFFWSFYSSPMWWWGLFGCTVGFYVIHAPVDFGANVRGSATAPVTLAPRVRQVAETARHVAAWDVAVKSWGGLVVAPHNSSARTALHPIARHPTLHTRRRRQRRAQNCRRDCKKTSKNGSDGRNVTCGGIIHDSRN